MNANRIIRSSCAAAMFAVAVGLAGTASAGGFGIGGWALYSDGSQAFNSRAIAGAAPNAQATYLGGIRCHYEYRVRWGPYGRERVRVEVCN